MSIKEKDLPVNLPAIVAEAKALWSEAAKAYYAEMGDVGSCILGDGIVMDVIPKGCRKSQKKTLIPSSSVACCQGSVHYEVTKDVAIEYLKAYGVDAYYCYGFMD